MTALWTGMSMWRTHCWSTVSRPTWPDKSISSFLDTADMLKHVNDSVVNNYAFVCIWFLSDHNVQLQACFLMHTLRDNLCCLQHTVSLSSVSSISRRTHAKAVSWWSIAAADATFLSAATESSASGPLIYKYVENQFIHETIQRWIELASDGLNSFLCFVGSLTGTRNTRWELS